MAKPQVETTKKFPCFSDTYIDSVNSTSNYGSTDLKVSYSMIKMEIAYLAFTVSDLPLDVTVIVVDLEIYVKSILSGNDPVYIKIYETSAFNESTLTWDNKPTPQDRLVSTGMVIEGTKLTLHLSEENNAIFEKHNVRGNGDYYFRILTTPDCISDDCGVSLTLGSRNDLLNHPKLAVTYEYSPTRTPTTSTSTLLTTTTPVTTMTPSWDFLIGLFTFFAILRVNHFRKES